MTASVVVLGAWRFALLWTVFPASLIVAVPSPTPLSPHAFDVVPRDESLTNCSSCGVPTSLSRDVDVYNSVGGLPAAGVSVGGKGVSLGQRAKPDGTLSVEGSEGLGFHTRELAPAAVDPVVILDTARALHVYLRALVNDELGLTELQATFDKLERDSEALETTLSIDEIQSNIEEKIKRYHRLLEETCVAAKLTPVEPTDRRTSEKFVACCELPSKILRFDQRFGVEASFEFPCRVDPSSGAFGVHRNQERGDVSASSNLSSVMVEHQVESPTLKWQFAVTESDVLLRYPSSKPPDYSSSFGEKLRLEVARGSCGLGYNDIRHKSAYFAAIYQKTKFFILMIDHGNATSASTLLSSLDAAKSILTMIPDNALVNAISVGDRAVAAIRRGISWNQQFIKREVEGCSDDGLHGLLPLSPKILESLALFLGSVGVSKGATNHTAAFRMAIDLAKPHLQRRRGSSDEVILHLLYITSGALAGSHLEPILDALASLGRRRRVKVSVLVPPSEKSPLDGAAGAFLETLASFGDPSEDILGNAVDDAVHSKSHRESSMYYLGDHPTGVRGILDDIFSKIEKKSTSVRFSMPVWDSVGQGPVVTASKYCSRHSIVVGLDVPLAELVDFALYQSATGKNGYAFVIDNSGHVFMHPKFPRPLAMKEQPPSAYISELERSEGFDSVIERILMNASGESNSTLSSTNVIYSWRRISGSPFIVCTAKEQEKRVKSSHPKTGKDPGKKDGFKSARKALRLVAMAPEDKTRGVADLLYHRLDAVPSIKGLRFCEHYHRLATLDRSAVFFSPVAFLDPLPVLVRSREENEKAAAARAQTYIAYIKDATDLIGNPGFRHGVKRDAQALGLISSYWTRQSRDHYRFGGFDPVGPLQHFVVRRYVSTARGVSVHFPATTVENEASDPTRETWFLRSRRAPGRIMFTGPLLDAGGAGYVVSISHSVFEGKMASLHSSTDSVVGVMGMDMTSTYLHRVLVEWLPHCDEEENPGLTCFLMDDEGYVVSHPALFHPKSPLAASTRVTPSSSDFLGSAGGGNSGQSREQLHVTHMEPVLANDLLHRGDVVTKKSCDRVADSTTQRYYKFNATVGYVVESRIRGEMCGSYLLTAVPGTNLLLGVLNLTSCPDLSTALFCPCSTEDRSCFHCNRMEQKECECPCECPLGMGRCGGGPDPDDDEEGPSAPDKNNTAVVQREVRELCPAPAEQPVPVKRSGLWVRPDLLPRWDRIPACTSVDCRSLMTRKQCLGVSGCSWCKYEADGATRLRDPFCGRERTCFWGVLDATSPYGEIMREETGTLGDSTPARSSPLGPVAGCVMACFLFMALSVYCYWHRGAKDRLSLANSMYGQGRRMGDGEGDDQDERNEKRGRRRYGSSSDYKMGKFPDYDDDGEGENGDDVLEILSGTELSSVERGSSNGPSKQRRRRYLPGSVGDSDDHGYSTMTPLEDNGSEHNNQGPYHPNSGRQGIGFARNPHHAELHQSARRNRDRTSGRFGSPARRFAAAIGDYHQVPTPASGSLTAQASLLNPYSEIVDGSALVARRSSRPSSPLVATEQSVVSAADSAHGTDYNGTGHSTSSAVDDDDDDSSREDIVPASATVELTTIHESCGSIRATRGSGAGGKAKPPWEMAGFQGNRVVASVQVHSVDA